MLADHHPTSTAHIWTARRVIGAALTCLALVVAATLFGVVGSIIGIMALSVTIGAGVRTVLVLGAVGVVIVVGHRLSTGGPRLLWVATGLLAYLALPAAWSGRALIASAVDLTGVVAWAVDALVWTVAVVLVVRSRPEIQDNRIDTSGLR